MKYENLSMILWFTELYFKRKSEQLYFLKKHLFTSGTPEWTFARPGQAKPRVNSKVSKMVTRTALQ